MIRFHFSQTAFFFKSNFILTWLKRASSGFVSLDCLKDEFPSSKNTQACPFSFCGEEIILGACLNLHHEFVKGLYN